MIDLIFILVLAFLFSAFLTGPAGWIHPRDASLISGALFLFLLFGLVLWVSYAWMDPLGPSMLGFAWTGPLVIGLILTFLLLAVSTPGGKSSVERPMETPGGTRPRSRPSGGAFGIFFWLLMVGLVYLALTAP